MRKEEMRGRKFNSQSSVQLTANERKTINSRSKARD